MAPDTLQNIFKSSIALILKISCDVGIFILIFGKRILIA